MGMSLRWPVLIGTATTAILYLLGTPATLAFVAGVLLAIASWHPPPATPAVTAETTPSLEAPHLDLGVVVKAPQQ